VLTFSISPAQTLVPSHCPMFQSSTIRNALQSPDAGTSNLTPRESICIELMTSDRKLKASREGSK